MIGFLGGALLVCALLSLAYWGWSRRIENEVREGADVEWDRLHKAEPELLAGYDKARFTEIYRRVHFPRFPGYALAVALSFVASLPFTLTLIGGSVWISEKLGLIPEPAQLTRYVPLGKTPETPDGYCDAECRLYVVEAYSGFYFFFAIIAIWLAIVAFFMRRYHARRPGYLRDELIRNRP